jgi:hypothetical protein
LKEKVWRKREINNNNNENNNNNNFISEQQQRMKNERLIENLNSKNSFFKV